MQTIGERLEEARKRKGLTIREAAEATKIRGDYLQKFESNHFDLKIPDIYVRGFLRIYAVFLRLPPEKLLHDLAGLHLAETRPGARTLSREVYGRMELSVATAKPAAHAEAPAEGTSNAGAPLPAAGAGEPPRGDNNPATFRPRGTQGPPLSPALVGKALLLLASVGGAVYAAVWGIQVLTGSAAPGGSGGRLASASLSAAATNPEAGGPSVSAAEPILKIYALDVVTVNLVNKSDKSVLFSGKLSKDQVQSVPRRDAIDVTADPFQNIEFEIDGHRYPMPGQRGATIAAPKAPSR